jgi:hypothetical protein
VTNVIVFVGMVIRHVPTMILDLALLVVAVEILDVQASAPLVIAKVGSGACLKSDVVGASTALGVQVLTEITVRRFELLYEVRSDTLAVITVSGIELEVAMGIVHVVHVVLLLHLPVVLVLEDLREDAFGVVAVALVLDLHIVALIILNVHTSAVDSVELILHSVALARASSGTGGAWIVPTLRD